MTILGGSRRGHSGGSAPLTYTGLQDAGPPRSVSEILEASGLGSYTSRVLKAKIDSDVAPHLQPADVFSAFERQVPFGDCVRILLALQDDASVREATKSVEREATSSPCQRGWWTMPSMFLEAAAKDGNLSERMGTWIEMGAVITTLFLSFELDMDKSKMSDCTDFWARSTCENLVLAQNVLRTVGQVGTVIGCIYAWGLVAVIQCCTESQLDESVRKHWPLWGSFATGTGLLGVVTFCLSVAFLEMIKAQSYLDVALANGLVFGVITGITVFHVLVARVTGASGIVNPVWYVLGWTSTFGFYGPREPLDDKISS